MSLLDTIKGAREEAQEAGTLVGANRGKSNKSAATDDEAKDAAQAGFSRRSTARAKPTREAAGSVRVQSTSGKPASEMTKEERKAARSERRREEDLVYDAKKAVLNQMPEYRRTQRVWWAMLIAGVVCTLISWGSMRMLSTETAGEGLAAVAMGFMVVAYVLVIGAFIYDLVRVRPLRNEANDKLAGMSKRRLQRVIEEDEAQKAAKKEKK